MDNRAHKIPFPHRSVKHGKPVEAPNSTVGGCSTSHRGPVSKCEPVAQWAVEFASEIDKRRTIAAMKLITATLGISAIRVPADDFSPPNGIPVGDIEASLIETYKCAKYVMPQLQQLPPGLTLPGLPSIWMQGGHLELGTKKLPLQFILVFQNGLWVSTPSATENADEVMTHLTKKLDADFGFRIAVSPKDQYWTSNVVVEFSKAVEQLSHNLATIIEIVNRAIPRTPTNPNRLQFRRLTLGYDGHDETTTTFENIEWTEFSIERRIKTSYALNRFHSNAPMPTASHLETLQAIETALEG
jgi:hypothetical protein